MARARSICLFLALVTVLAYLPVRNAGFIVFDDPIYTQNQPRGSRVDVERNQVGLHDLVREQLASAHLALSNT